LHTRLKKFRIAPGLLTCYAVSTGKYLPAFRKCVVPLYFACCFVWV
jgi:hypothetical protein